MNGKTQESALYLKCCNSIETETFRLYENLSKKINQPESSFALGIAYDSLKCAKTIQAILEYFDLKEIENMSCKKNLTELASNATIISKKISKTNNVNYEMACELLRYLSDYEEHLSQVYANFVDSPLIRISDEFSPLVINSENFKKIFENFAKQKQTHKEIIVEIIYSIERKEADRLRNVTPLVRYKNPDSWIHEAYSSPVTTQSTSQ